MDSISIIKLVNRVLHLTSTGLRDGVFIFNYMFAIEELLAEESKYETFINAASVLSFVTAIINLLVIPYGKEIDSNSTASMWKHMQELKLIGSLFLTPAIKPLIHQLSNFELIGSSQKDHDDFKKVFQFYIVIFLMVLSTCAKTFREFVCNNFDKDPVATKVEQF